MTHQYTKKAITGLVVVHSRHDAEAVDCSTRTSTVKEAACAFADDGRTPYVTREPGSLVLMLTSAIFQMGFLFVGRGCRAFTTQHHSGAAVD